MDGDWYCSRFFTPSTQSEFMPDRVRDDRREYFNSTIQPFRQGELSKEYIDLYGTDSVNVSKYEIKKAKNVWTDLEGYNTRDRSK